MSTSRVLKPAISATPSALTAHLGYWVRYVSNQVSHAFASRLAGAGATVAEWVLMRELYEAGPLAPSRLANGLGMTRGAISKIADRLLTKDLILRHDNDADGRAHTLTLSPAGKALVPRLASIADENDAEFFGDLSDAERETLNRVMRAIVERKRLKAVPVT